MKKSFLFVLMLCFCFSSCLSMTAEQQAKFDKAEADIVLLQGKIADKIQEKQAVIEKLKAGTLKPEEIKAQVLGLNSEIVDLKLSYADAKTSLNELKGSGVSTWQLVGAATGGALFRTVLHSASPLLAGTPLAPLIPFINMFLRGLAHKKEKPKMVEE